MSDKTSNALTLGSGWTKDRDDGSWMVTGTLVDKEGKNVLWLQQEDGTMVQLTRFYLAQNKFKKTEKHPDFILRAYAAEVPKTEY